MKNENVLCGELLRKLEDVRNAIPNHELSFGQEVRQFLEGMMFGVSMMRDEVLRHKEREETQANKCL
jgi:hypothetical protein